MRNTFQLGGKSFTAPDPIGAGVRARIAQITSDIADEKKVPNKTEADTEAIIKRYYYDYSLRLLEIILTGETSIKEAYDSATDAEVKEVMDFFALNVNGKTLTETGKTKDSKDSKKTAQQST